MHSVREPEAKVVQMKTKIEFDHQYLRVAHESSDHVNETKILHTIYLKKKATLVFYQK